MGGGRVEDVETGTLVQPRAMYNRTRCMTPFQWRGWPQTFIMASVQTWLPDAHHSANVILCVPWLRAAPLELQSEAAYT